MVNSLGTQIYHMPARLVPANEDQFGEHRGLGVSAITFKVTPKDSDGVFIIENTFHEKGGPAKHLHYHQDEWFFAVEGEFILEVGQEKFKVNSWRFDTCTSQYSSCLGVYR